MNFIQKFKYLRIIFNSSIPPGTSLNLRHLPIFK